MKLWDEASEEWKAVPTLKGDPGPKGDQGIPGAGLIPGGTVGQVLKKKSEIDYDTEWGDGNNIIELEELPIASDEYINNIYKIDNKLYVCMSGFEIIRRTIQVGDNLDSKTLYCDLPDDFYTNIQYANPRTVIYTDTNSNLVEGANNPVFEECFVTYRDSDFEINYIYDYDNVNSELDLNLKSVNLPDDFGIVNAVDIDTYSYSLITADFDEEMFYWEEYGGNIPDNLITSSNESVTDIMSLTKVEYDALPQIDKDTNTYFITDDLDGAIETVDIITDGTPVNAGYKIDGKDVYVKRVSFGSIGLVGNNDVDSGIPNDVTIIRAEGTAIRYSDNNTLCIPYGGNGYITLAIVTTSSVSSHNYVVRLVNGVDRTEYDGYINVYFIY